MRTSRLFLLSTALIVTLSTPLHAEPLFGGFGASAWSRAYKYIESRFGQVAKDEVVMVLPTATNAAWDDPVKVLRLFEMYKWGDWMPSMAWQYAPNSGKRVSDGYQYFLNAALNAAIAKNGTLSEDAKNAVIRVSDEVAFIRGDYTATMKSASDAYDAYVQATPPPRMTKEKFNKDRGWNIEIDVRKERLDKALETLQFTMKKIVDPDVELLRQAIVRYNSPDQKIWLPPVKDVLGNPDRWQQYYVSYIDKKISDFLTEKNPQTETIDESQSESSYFEQQWKASVSVSFLGLIRAGGASAEQVKREEHIRNNATRIDVSFTNLDTFNISRGEWYSENVVSRFAPFFKGEAYTTIWGPNGQMELLPKSLLVGRGMKLSVYADSQSLDYLYEHFEAGADAGISIGWWRIGGEGGYSSTKSETKVSKFADHIEFVDLSGRAKVLAVLCKHYAAGLPREAVAANLTAAERSEAASQIKDEWGKSDTRSLISGVLDEDVQMNVLPAQ